MPDAFACIALTDCDLSDDFPSRLDVGDGITASRTLPFALPEHWQRWLGELTCRALERDVVVLHLRVAVERDSDAQGVAALLLERLNFTWHGVILQGVPAYDDAHSMVGTAAEEYDVKSFQTEHAYVRTMGAPRFVIGPGELRRAVLLGERIGRLKPEMPDFDRLRRSSRSLFTASRELNAGERLHGSARALEALILPDRGRTRVQFVSRCSEFAVSAAQNRDALAEIYDIRSGVEHLHEPLDVLRSGSRHERAARADRRTRQAVALARFSLARVLERDELLVHFGTDETIAAFWRLPAGERTPLWGEPFDLDSIR